MLFLYKLKCASWKYKQWVMFQHDKTLIDHFVSVVPGHQVLCGILRCVMRGLIRCRLVKANTLGVAPMSLCGFDKD